MEMNVKASTIFSTLVFLASINLSLVSCRKIISNRGVIGFTLDLIHRDSPSSPFYNPSTQSDRLRNAFHRSISRASFFKKSSFATPDTIQSDISPIPGEYLMKLSIGTPPVEIVAIADTGSDLTWTQCKPCDNCFEQSYPLFDSKKSSTYKTIRCDDEECASLMGSSSCVRRNVCEYQMSYGDQSQSIGDLASDKFTFPSTSGKDIAIPNVAFGCGYDNSGTFNNYTSGIIGLGGGELSIIKQLDKQINGKFSYCLIPISLDSSMSNVTSHINFGNNAIVSGSDVVSTPLVKKEPSTFYYLTLEGVSVGNKTLKFKSSKTSSSIGDEFEEGNIIIDSGTTLTFLPSEFYENLESALVDSISATKKRDSSGTFNLCYESDENGTIDAPTIVAHFTNADLELSQSSTFALVDEGLVCLTIVPGQEFAIFGNLAQMNYLIGYDLEENKISFKPTDCTKY
ncbi:aspartic proteinase CDR1-like [Capsicum galapagoense]